MTELLSRPGSTTASYDGPHAAQSVWWRGALGATWAASLGVASLIVVVLLAWATDSRTGASAGSAIRAALQVWLVAQRVPLHVSGGSIAIAPLFLTLALVALVARAAAVVARGQEARDLGDALRVAVAVALPYCALTTFVAAAAHSSAVSPAPIAALACGLVVGLLGSLWGAARGSGLVGSTWQRLPEHVRAPVGAGAASLGVLLAGSMLLLAAALLVRFGEASRSVSALGGGTVGAVAIVALSLALLPNAATCTLGYLAGPGFALGADTSVTLTGTHAGPLPTFPLMAAVPSGPAPTAVEAAGIVLLVCAGVTAAWLVARAGHPLRRSMGYAVAAGAAAGVLAAVAAALGGGPAGPGRMAAVGTSPWQAGLAVAAEVAVVACGAAGAMTWRRGR